MKSKGGKNPELEAKLSTLIGRMLYDSKMIFEDQLESLEADSKRVGTQGEKIDFALLVDGLAAEREQVEGKNKNIIVKMADHPKYNPHYELYYHQYLILGNCLCTRSKY